MALVDETWVQVMGVESNVVSLGKRPNPRDLESLENSRVIIIVPGNPGLASFYEEFMLTLQEQLGDPALTIWAFSYIGHETRSPSLVPTDPTYNLEDQVAHKLALLDLLLPHSAKITLVGHSIGCRIVLDTVSRNTTHTVENVYFLFPTIENMVSTPQGRKTLTLTSTWRPLLLAILTVLNLLLPSSLLRYILSLCMPQSPEAFIRAASRWRNPNYLNNCLVLAQDELKTVLDLDAARIATLAGLAGRLKAYYGTTDGWVPLSYRTSLLQKIPSLGEGNLQVCEEGVAHAFVEKSGGQIARVVAAWEGSM